MSNGQKKEFKCCCKEIKQQLKKSYVAQGFCPIHGFITFYGEVKNDNN